MATAELNFNQVFIKDNGATRGVINVGPSVTQADVQVVGDEVFIPNTAYNVIEVYSLDGQQLRTQPM